MRFTGRAALVTGGGSGIGKATAIAFAKDGASVCVVDIDAVSAEKTVSEIKTAGGKAIAVAGDIALPSTATNAVSGCVKTFGGVDFLFNNAGVEFISPLMETSESDWDRVMDVNMKGTYLITKACLEVMVPKKFGVITNNASDAGLRGIKVNAAYSSSKAGIIHMTRSLSLDYASQGIRTNCICPGCIRTPLCERFNAEVGARKGISGEQALQEFVEANIPMQRVGTPEEVASVVTFLCSDDARYINGAIIPIDGGLTAGM
ncbi:MAG: SDR family oxidoreductase [Candidatus Obscuribacterales bacterium]|nr:SDR family oxidoreductase [Candidatus Obscuribacterales bacterium]